MKPAKNSKKQAKPQVAILMGSDSDLPVMKEAADALARFGIAFEMMVLSAHRTPAETAEYAKKAAGRGIRVIIAGAGGAAHLAGAVAAQTVLPVIGIPVPNGPLQGHDALLSTVQMPKGIPVATVAIGGAFNAGLLAVQIIAAGGSEQDKKLLRALEDYKLGLRREAQHKNKKLQETLQSA